MTAGPTPLTERRAGVLLHPTSLPSGTLGRDARRFVDWLAAGGFSVWQVLPLGPTDHKGSPYQLRSAFAGNTALIDPIELTRCSWWPENEPPRPDLMTQAWDNFRRHASNGAWAAFGEYRRQESRWLLPYALFAVLSERHGGHAWWDWPEELHEPRPAMAASLLSKHMAELNAVMFGQYLFDLQWRSLRRYARDHGVYLFGDLPFYMDRNSADVWWRRRSFRLEEDGTPPVVAGVPPDYFNADGQWWGNPLYDWEAQRADGFRWWLTRLGHQARWFDLLRLDHFRALESCWAIPADADSARDGHWETVPGAELLAAVQAELPGLALVAEDLGTITPEVRALRRRFGLPGMLILQFAFDGSPDNPYLPGNHETEAVVYTGTHDNDTTAGWYASLEPAGRDYVDAVLDHPASPAEAASRLVREALRSPARLAMLPLQDLLGLGSEARMNRPGTAVDNWSWRFDWSQLDDDLPARYLEWNTEHDRRDGSAAVQQALV